MTIVSSAWQSEWDFKTLLFKKLRPCCPSGPHQSKGPPSLIQGTTMQVNGCPVDLLVGTRYGGIDGDDVLIHQKQVMEGDLDWFISLSHNEPAQMGRLDVPAKSSGWGEPHGSLGPNLTKAARIRSLNCMMPIW